MSNAGLAKKIESLSSSSFAIRFLLDTHHSADDTSRRQTMVDVLSPDAVSLYDWRGGYYQF